MNAALVVPVVIGEGRVVRIDLPLDGAEVGLLSEEDPESPVVLTFRDPATRYYVRIYDHRQRSRETFRRGDDEAFERAFYETPCLVGFRLKNGQYVVINDIGTPDMRDGGGNEALILTARHIINHAECRVMSGNKPAIHHATGICLVEPRPKPPP